MKLINHQWKWSVPVILAVFVSLAPASAQPIEAPEGAIVQRYIDLAAERAFSEWVADLRADSKAEAVERIGMVRLDGDPGDLTSILQGQLTRLDDLRIVTLGGSVWRVIENELARTDPEEGYGDIFNQATIIWGEDQTIPQTVTGPDAILLGHVRSVERSWLRTIVRVQIFLARVDTREQLAGGIYTGEAVLSPRDAFFYYTWHIVWGVVILAGVLIALVIMRSLLRAMTRPR